MGNPKLKEDYKIPQKMNIGELVQRMNSMEHGASFQTMGDTDLKSKVDSKFIKKESLESIDVFQKKKIINIEVELQDEIIKGKKFKREIEDLHKKWVNLEEEKKALKTEVQMPIKNNDGSKRLIVEMESNGWGGASTLKSHKMICISS